MPNYTFLATAPAARHPAGLVQTRSDLVFHAPGRRAGPTTTAGELGIENCVTSASPLRHASVADEGPGSSATRSTLRFCTADHEIWITTAFDFRTGRM
ncbi:hypothetical protein GCM10010435_48690 [Winogradskya consettensis]|uniref:Uncharacterized protein n=1 Tax=Winogradskya consettensis TaxID=113560 RepID=A0A919SK83_9ACTN|nr:hypothetical protein Aco04nite_33620 [Actinoplanes consettensis]